MVFDALNGMGGAVEVLPPGEAADMRGPFDPRLAQVCLGQGPRGGCPGHASGLPGADRVGVQAALEEFLGEWGSRYPAIGVLWRGAWEDFVPFLDWRRQSAR